MVGEWGEFLFCLPPTTAVGVVVAAVGSFVDDDDDGLGNWQVFAFQDDDVGVVATVVHC